MKYTFVFLGFAAIPVLFLAWFASMPTPFIVDLQAEFDSLPPNDDELEAWLNAQPSIFRAHCERKSKSLLRISFTHERSALGALLGKSPFPDVEAACDQLGYKGRKEPFEDTP